jgi:hypothetical protein
MTKFVIIKNISNEKQQPVKPQTQNTIPSIKQKSSLNRDWIFISVTACK